MLTSDNKNYLHGSLTLDEYYYAALGNIDERDDDQVVGRYFAKQLELKQEPEPKDENKSPPARPILLVNQLWLWIIDDGMLTKGSSRVRRWPILIIATVYLTIRSLRNHHNQHNSCVKE